MPLRGYTRDRAGTQIASSQILAGRHVNCNSGRLTGHPELDVAGLSGAHHSCLTPWGSFGHFDDTKEAVADVIPHEKTRPQKRVLVRPDLEQSKPLNSFTPKSGQRTYDRAITDFVA
jgi:hypothetical protein